MGLCPLLPDRGPKTGDRSSVPRLPSSLGRSWVSGPLTPWSSLVIIIVEQLSTLIITQPGEKVKLAFGPRLSDA